MDSQRNCEPARGRFLPDGDSRAVILVVDDEPDTLAIFRLYLAIQALRKPEARIREASNVGPCLRSLDGRAGQCEANAYGNGDWVSRDVI